MKKFEKPIGRAPLVSILGDSISTLNGYIPQGFHCFYEGTPTAESGVHSVADTWWGRVIETIAGELLANNSFAGSRMAMDIGCKYHNYGCDYLRTGALSKDGKKPDLIMVFMGINDLGSHSMHMLPEVEGDAGSIRVFSVAYETALADIRARYPEATVLCITPGRGFVAGKSPILPPPDVRRGAMCGVIKALAAQYDCLFFDLSEATPYESLDGIHPTASGMKTIADGVLSVLL